MIAGGNWMVSRGRLNGWSKSTRGNWMVARRRLTGWPKKTANTVIDLLGFSKETS